MIKSGLIPTARAVADINRGCNAKCRMCYYAYDDSKWSKPFQEVQKELLAARERGNTSVDFTGGEPTIYPPMDDVIQYAESIGLHTSIITNGIALENIKKLTEAGCHEWLVSIHGFERQHDDILQVEGAWDKVNRTVEYLNQSGCFVRVNCTITKYSAPDLPKLAQYYVDFVRPRIINFINFNPHYQWGDHNQPEIYQRLNEVQVKVSDVAPYLKEALDILNSHNLWTNVRYFPFCPLGGYETHICNNPQVMFDPYEWDYGVAPKTTESYLAHGRWLQDKIGSKEGACGRCGILNVCGGIHRNYLKIHGDPELDPYSEQSDYPYHFKKDIEADIVIPVYETNLNIQKLLLEITRNTAPPYNLILVSRSQSAAKNRNYGMERAKSPYVIMCDDDIEALPPAWNRRLINILKENREILAVSARLMLPGGRPGPNTANNYDLSQPLVPVEIIPTACCVFRRTDVRFDERYIRAGWEDTDFFMQLKEKYGEQFAIANTVRVIHLNEEKNNGGMKNLFNQQLFSRKWQKNLEVMQLSPESSPISDNLNEVIRKYIEQRDFESAIPLLQRAIQEGNTDAELFNNLGYACWELGQKEKALECFYQAATLNPGDKDILANFFDASYALNQYGLLEEYLRKMSEANPQANEYLYLLADCLFKQDRYLEAKKFLAELISEDPDYPGAKGLMAQVEACPTDGPCGIASPLNNRPTAESIDIRIFNHAKYITKRGCIDIGHICDIECLFCYHRFEDRGKRRFLCKQEIMERLRRDQEEYGITITDFTGGEPTLHPDIVEIVRYGNSIGNPICIITHGQWGNLDRIDAIIDAGLYEFLISIHGVERDHDLVTNPGAFKKIIKGIEHLEKRGVRWRLNCVAHAMNMENFGGFARMISNLSYPPYNSNFIVFSPLAGWCEREDIDFQAKHSDLAPYLREAIEVFSENRIWTNIRYFSMCMLPGLEGHITCFPQICYDPFEWDYRSYNNMDANTIMQVYQLGKKAGVYGETEGHIFYNTWSFIQSQRCYRKGAQCISCSLCLICDGLAYQYRERFGTGELKEIQGRRIKDPIYFRRYSHLAVGD